LTTIARIIAREVLDSRGNPTVEAEVHCQGGAWGRAIVPSGASTGAAEAIELRDKGSDHYEGLGVARAVENVRQVLAPAIVGMSVENQRALDARLVELDGSPQKSALGANALLAVSLAAAHAAAAARGLPLYRHLHDLFRQLDPAAPPPRVPVPMVNMISGGLHAGGNLDYQDFLTMCVGARDYPQALEWTVRIYRHLGALLAREGFEGRLVGDEGGYGPRLAGDEQAAEYVTRAIESAGLQPGEQVTIAIDVASSHFYSQGEYRLAARGGARLTSGEMIDHLAGLVARFPVTSIEDGLAEDDWSAWQHLTARLGSKVRLVGDDLFATNPERLRRGIELRAANSILIKVNQIGTLSETLGTIRLAREHGYRYVVSARSGESEDTTIADLAVATAADHIKIGAVARSERLAKYNQLLRIAEELSSAPA